MKKIISVIITAALICSLSACGMNNTADNTSSAQTSAIETAGSEVSVETSTETVDTDVFEKDGSDVVIDTENSNVEISETSDGTKVATVKTDDGKEVKVAVKEDESGKTIVDTSKVINDEGQVENNIDSSKNKTEVTVNDDGKVTIKTEVSVPVETSNNNSTNSKPSETSKKPVETSKPTENSKSSDTSKPAETSKSSESSNTETTPTKKIAAETEESSSTIEATSITLNKSSLTLKVGETTTLTATINPSNATDKTVHWKSTNNSIVTVNNGKITAIKSGTVTITASTNCNCKEAICKVTVINNEQSSIPSTPSTVEVTSITLNKSSVTLEEGKTTTLTATVNPSNATNKNVTWSSDNTNVATVNNGTVTAKKAGTANIIAKSNNGKIATCKVTVNHVHNWVAQTKTVHHDEVYHYEDVYEDYIEKIYYSGIHANDSLLNQEGYIKDPLTGEISFSKDYLGREKYSPTPWGIETPWWMLFERYNLCTLNDILNLKYDWITIETKERKYEDYEPEFYENGYTKEVQVIYHINGSKVPDEWFSICLDYCGSTTSKKSFIKSIPHHEKIGTKKVIDKAAYDEKVVDYYECSCGATK